MVYTSIYRADEIRRRIEEDEPLASDESIRIEGGEWDGEQWVYKLPLDTE